MTKKFKILLETNIWSGKRYRTETKWIVVSAENLLLAKEKAEQTNPNSRMSMGWPE